MKKVIGLTVVFILVIGAMVYLRSLSKPGAISPDNGGKEGPVTNTPPAAVKTPTVIRIGYPSKILISAHLGQTLTRTNILEKNYLKGQITNFENEAAVIQMLNAKALDIAFLSDLSAIVTLGNGYNGLIAAYIGPLGRTDLVVLPNSPVKTFRDLKDKTIGLTQGTPAHRNLVKWLKEQSMTSSDVKLVHFNEPSLQSLEAKLADALILADPQLEKYVQASRVTGIYNGQYYGVVLISRDFYTQSPDAVYNFIYALKESFFFLSLPANKPNVNKWVEQIAKIENDLVWRCSEINMFYSNRDRQISKLRLGISDSLMATLKDIAIFAQGQKLIPAPLVVENIVDKKLNDEAGKEINQQKYNPGEVKVLQQ